MTTSLAPAETVVSVGIDTSASPSMAWPLAEAIKAKLEVAQIKPVADCDNKHVVVTRQGSGEIDYFFRRERPLRCGGPPRGASPRAQFFERAAALLG